MAKQVGPALGKPITTLALQAASNDWLPCAWIPSWPGAETAPAERPQIRLQSVPLAIPQDRSDAANNNDGAL